MEEKEDKKLQELCKKKCNKLGLGLELNSEKDVGTEVKIVFPKSSFISETF